MGLSPEVRYSVNLIVRTNGSLAAWRMNSSTELTKLS